MIRFLDGPASRVVLCLRRAPVFLRAVFNPRSRKDQWDALDELDDEAKPHEELYAYRRIGPKGRMHLKACRAASGWYETGEYRLVDAQPDEATMRDTAAWRVWCYAQMNAETQRAKP